MDILLHELAIDIGFSLNSDYYHAGLNFGLVISDFSCGLEFSQVSACISINLGLYSYYILGGVIMLAVPVSTVIGGITGKKFKLYNQRRALHEKNKSYFLINLRPNIITEGIYTGRSLLVDSNSIAGIAVRRLGPHPDIGLFKVGDVWLWGIVSTPSNLGTVFRISTIGINDVGIYKVLYINRILVNMPNFTVTPLGEGQLTFN